MPLQSAGILKGAATIGAASGGTAATLSPDALSVPNGIHVNDNSVTDFRVRPNGTFKVRFPTTDAAGETSKDKKSATYVIPKLLANGKIKFNLIRIEREIHPESTAAEALELNTIGSQLLTDSDFAAFWSAGSVA